MASRKLTMKTSGVPVAIATEKLKKGDMVVIDVNKKTARKAKPVYTDPLAFETISELKGKLQQTEKLLTESGQTAQQLTNVNDNLTKELEQAKQDEKTRIEEHDKTIAALQDRLELSRSAAKHADDKLLSAEKIIEVMKGDLQTIQKVRRNVIRDSFGQFYLAERIGLYEAAMQIENLDTREKACNIASEALKANNTILISRVGDRVLEILNEQGVR